MSATFPPLCIISHTPHLHNNGIGWRHSVPYCSHSVPTRSPIVLIMELGHVIVSSYCSDSVTTWKEHLVYCSHSNGRGWYHSVPYCSNLKGTPALLFYYRQVQTCSDMSRLVLRKPKHVLDSDWTVVIKQPLRARTTDILSSYAKRTISEYSRENTALKKVLKVRFFFLAVV